MLVPKERHLPLFARATLIKQTPKTTTYDPITHTVRAYSVLAEASTLSNSRLSSPGHYRASSLPPISPYQPPTYQPHRITQHLGNPITGETLWYNNVPPTYLHPNRQLPAFPSIRHQHPRMAVDLRKELREIRQRK